MPASDGVGSCCARAGDIVRFGTVPEMHASERSKEGVWAAHRNVEGLLVDTRVVRLREGSLQAEIRRAGVGMRDGCGVFVRLRGCVELACVWIGEYAWRCGLVLEEIATCNSHERRLGKCGRMPELEDISVTTLAASCCRGFSPNLPCQCNSLLSHCSMFNTGCCRLL